MQLQSQIASPAPGSILSPDINHSGIHHPLLTTTALRIREPFHLADLLAVTVAQVRHTLRADRVLIYRAEGDATGIVLEESVASEWRSLKGQKVFDPHFSQYWQMLYEKGRIQATADIYSGELNPCYVGFLEKLQIRANLVVPILQRTLDPWAQRPQSEMDSQEEADSFQFWGLLTVQQCSAPRPWQPFEIDLIDQIVVQIEIAIQQADLYATLQKEVALRRSAEMALTQWAARFEQKQYDGIAEPEVVNPLLPQETTEPKVSGHTLLTEKGLAQNTLNSMGDGVISTDRAGNIHYLNPAAEQLMGWNLQEVKGLPLTDVFKIINELTRRPVENPIFRVLKSGLLEGLAPNTVLVSRDGTEYPIEDSAAPIRAKNGELLGAVLTFHDVTQSRSLARQLSWQANHDELTGLFNRRAFEQQLTDILIQSRTQQQTHTLCYLDLDRFKVVNDTCGHVAGDQLLQQITALFQERIRSTDILARLGGDEFGLLLHQCDLAQAECVADSLRALIQDFQFSWKDKVFKVGVSIGLVNIESTGETLDSILRAADAACYAAKEKGRNCIYVYRPHDDTLTQRRSEEEWIFRIDQALNEDRFCLYHQKILPLAQGVPMEYSEVLLRLVDEQGELIAPQYFIPVAERYHLISAIDQWVIKSFFASYRAFAQETSDGDIYRERLYNINLSGGSVNDGQFLGFLKEQLREYQVPPHRICFEITETTAIANLESASHLIHAVKDLGCSFALDDFGSGMSSLAYLKHLPVDYLKIDGGFVKDIVSNRMDYAMVEAFNHLSHLMGIQTIAECVENEPTLTTLKTIGVDFAQGFCISRPTPLVFSMENP